MKLSEQKAALAAKAAQAAEAQHVEPASQPTHVPKTAPASQDAHTSNAPHAIVIGAGISGLASAGLLAREGYRVTILEANGEVGGRAGVWERDGFRFDTGPSWYLMPEVFDHFYKLMGSSADEQLDLVTLDPGYRVYFEGESAPIDIQATREGNVALFESVEPGSGAKLEAYLDSAADTYEIAKKRFLYTTFQDFKPLIKRDVLARGGKLARLLLEPLATRAAKTVGDDRLQKILGYPAVFLGSSPYITPSLYHLMSHLDLSDGVLYPVGGFTRVIHTIADLATEAGVDIRTGHAVTRIVVENGAAVGVEYRVPGGQPQRLDADIVVSAADLHHTETKMLAPSQQTYPESYWKKSTAGPGGLLLYLGVTGEIPELEHHTLMFTREWQEGFDAIFGAKTSVPSPASLYVCKPSGVDPDTAPAGSTNLFVLVPIPSDPTIGRGDVDGDGDARIEALADHVIAQIASWARIPDLASRITVRRTVGPRNFVDELNSWKGTLLGPAHTLKQSAFFRAGNVSKKVTGLYYAGGSSIPGIGLPMCLISAEILIKRLRGDTSTGPLPEPLTPIRGALPTARARRVDVAGAATRAVPSSSPSAKPGADR
jgi:phytoene desaturase